MQKKEFTFKGVCSYILYRAMEEERASKNGLYESDQLSHTVCERVSDILQKIVYEQRIAPVAAKTIALIDDTRFEKI